MQLKPSCSWCKDYSRFEENRQLSLLVHCYRKLCLYITQSPLAPHVASAASSSPDLQAILSEGLTAAEGETESEDSSESLSLTQSASTSSVCQTEDAPLAKELKVEEPGSVGVNGLHGCNGLVSSDSLQHITIETGGGLVKQESFAEEIPICVSVTGTGDVGLCDIGSLGDDLKHGGGPLLLSVEEVLRTLETDGDPEPSPHADRPPSMHQSSLNGPQCHDSSHLTPSLAAGNSPPPLHAPPQPSPAAARVPPRYHRKRSHSESDSERVQPLPISSLIRGRPLGPISSPHHPNPTATSKQEPKYPAAIPQPHLAPVPNGGPPKVGKTVLVSNKALKKTVDHHGAPKKAYAKARQGAPKPRAQPRDRVPPHPHAHPLTHPPSPSKPQYKKPVEKKGCKCGRATQNPSVLTCRGQRCPCYSNRKVRDAVGDQRASKSIKARPLTAPSALFRPVWTVSVAGVKTPTWPTERRSWRPSPSRRKPWSRPASRWASTSPASRRRRCGARPPAPPGTPSSTSPRRRGRRSRPPSCRAGATTAGASTTRWRCGLTAEVGRSVETHIPRPAGSSPSWDWRRGGGGSGARTRQLQ